MKLSDTERATAEHALTVSMLQTDMKNWPDGLLLQLLQLDQSTRINEHLAAIREAMQKGVVLASDVLELIEQQLPTAPHVPDEEEAAEAVWQAQLNRELEHASIVAPVVDPDHYA